MRISCGATSLIVGIGLLVWAWNVMQPAALVDWDVRALRVRVECVERPFISGVLSGFEVGRTSCSTEPAEKDGVPRMVLEHVVRHSLPVYRFGQCVGFLVFCGVVWLARWLAGRFFPMCAAALLPVVLISGCCSAPLPRFPSSSVGGEYDRQAAGYSSLGPYGEAVGYYVAKVTAYSDVAHLPPSYGHIYGPLNVRRPLLHDDRIEVYQRDAFPADSWWRQGTVILGAAPKEGAEKAQEPKGEPRGAIGGEDKAASSASERRPLSERLKPLQEAGKSRGAKKGEAIREELMAYTVLDGQLEGNVVVLGGFIRKHAKGGGLILRLVGHGANEELMGRLMAAARETGFVDDVEMYNLRGTLMVGDREVANGIEVMLLRRTAATKTEEN